MTRTPVPPSGAIAAELEAEFEKRVHHNQNVNKYHRRALRKIAALEKQLEQLRCESPRPPQALAEVDASDSTYVNLFVLRGFRLRNDPVMTEHIVPLRRISR